jgi:hypothetical protein
MVMKVSLKIIGRNTKQRNAQYAAPADFCRIFTEDMKNLYFLSLVLTAVPQKAENCFVSGLDDCSTGNLVFAEWARSWARRVIIKSAIRAIAPQPEPAHQFQNAGAARGVKPWTVKHTQPPVEISAVLGLPDFERFAFVMSVLEGYSDQDCALLLGCTRESVMAARVNALQQLGRSAEASGLREEVTSLQRGSVQDGDRVRLATPA